MDSKLKVYLPSLPNLSFSHLALNDALYQARKDLVEQLVARAFDGDSIHGQRPWIRNMFAHSEKADAFIFPPVTSLPHEHEDFESEALQRWFEFISLVTGTHIGSRENYHPDGLSKPCIVMDPDGEWSLAIDLLKDLNQKGMFSSNVNDIVRVVTGDPKDKTNYKALNLQAVEALTHALAEEERKSQSHIKPLFSEDHHFPTKRKDIKRHPFGIAIFGSASTKIDSYKQSVFDLARLAGERGWRMVTGGGNLGCMGAADEGFEAGRKRFEQTYPGAYFQPAHIGVSTHAILRLEGPPSYLDQLIITADIYERMQVMIRGQQASDPKQRTRDAVKVFFITPGGTGTLHELATLLQLATNGGMMEGRTIVLLNPPNHLHPQDTNDSFWKPLLAIAEKLGFRSRFEVARTPEAAIKLADEVYLKWQAARPEHKNLPHPVLNPV